MNTRLLVALGDTATAERTLSAPLDSLVALHTATLQYMPLAGCLVRNMALRAELAAVRGEDRKSTRLNSSHGYISYAVFCLKKKKENLRQMTEQCHVDNVMTCER